MYTGSARMSRRGTLGTFWDPRHVATEHARPVPYISHPVMRGVGATSGRVAFGRVARIHQLIKHGHQFMLAVWAVREALQSTVGVSCDMVLLFYVGAIVCVECLGHERRDIHLGQFL